MVTGTRWASWPLRPWQRLVLAALAGGMLGLGQAPYGMAVVGFAGLVLGFGLARGDSRPGRVGWVFGAAYFAFVLSWIIEPFQVDAARHAWMAPFALGAMAGGLALFWMVALALGARLGARSGAVALGMATALALAELARGHVLTGFPWALPGYIWLDTPLVRGAALVGPYGLTALTVLAAGGTVDALWRPAGTGSLRAKSGPIRGPGRGLALLPMLALIAAGGLGAPPDGAYSGAPGTGDSGAERPVIRLIQPNAAQHLKWHPDWVETFFRRQLDMTASTPAPGARAPDLTVWPEVALAFDLAPGAPARALMLDAANGRPVIAGHLDWSVRDQTYNALSLIAPATDPAAPYPSYRKHHLVPFGEYIPLGNWLERLGIDPLAANPGAAFAAGPGPVILDAGPGLGRFLPLICYEAVFPRAARVRGARPDWLLHLTNDAWFGTTAGPYQHLAQARMRAIEQGLAVVRVANTGISAIIDPHGRLTHSIPLGVAGALDAPLPPALPATPYARMGSDLPVLILLAALLAVLAIRRRRISD